jgi:hypothetical protein
MPTATNGQLWRRAGWGALAALLLLPALGMRTGREGLHWTGFDFAVAAALLALLGLGVELAARVGGGWRARLGMAVAVLAAVLLVWINLSVGVIGSERNDANLLFAGVLAVAVGGSWLARLRPAGMARVMAAPAGAQTLVGIVAVALGLGADGRSWPWDVVGATLLFDALWLAAAGLFHAARRDA